MSNTKNYLVSSLLAGAIMALLSAIPYVSSLNFCCCLWVLVGGFWAAYLFWSAARSITVIQGVVVGMLAGTWAAPIYSALTAILWRTMSDQFIAQFNQVMETSNAQIPPEMLDLITEFSTSPIIAFLVVLCGSLIVFPIIAAIGSTIGALIFGKRKEANQQT